MQIQSRFSSCDLGCSDFQVTTKNQKVIAARSMEFPVRMLSQIVVYPRAQTYTSEAPDGSAGLSWTSKYRFIGIDAFHLKNPVEGMNEAGLSFGFLTLKSSIYQTVSESQKKQALVIMDVGNWILSNFATVNEVKEALPEVRIWGKFVTPINEVPALHIALHDAGGGNLVIEFIEGVLKVYDNPIGILTNDPPFPEQLSNLSKYNHLTAEIAPDIEFRGVSIPSLGLGSSMLGLPGDKSSLSRFVNLFTALRLAPQPENEMDGIVMATHVLNDVDILKGLVMAKLEDSKLYETTLWCTIKLLSERIFIYRCYNDMTLKSIDLKKISFDKTIPYKPITLQASEPTIIDVTDQLLLN